MSQRAEKPHAFMVINKTEHLDNIISTNEDSKKVLVLNSA